MKKSAQVVVTSDHHVGSTVGLCPPVVYLDDGGEYTPNRLQKEAWKFWEKEFWPTVWRRAKSRKTILVFNGDMIDGDHHATNQIWSKSLFDQTRVATDIFVPHTEKADATYVVRGTAAHVQPSGTADETIAQKIKARRADGLLVGARSVYHLMLNVYGIEMNIAHHGPNPGRRLWTYGNELRSYTRTIVLDGLISRGNGIQAKVPDCLVRSHVHHRVSEVCKDYGHTCYSFITPAWQWKTEYAHRVVSHEDIADVGGLIIDIDDGEITNAEFKLLPISQSAVANFK